MSTATPPPPVRMPAPVGGPRMPQGAGPGAASSVSGFANIDPIRLLRRYWPLLAISAVVGAIIGTAAHFALLNLYPTWTSTATFACYPPRTTVTELRGDAMQQADFDRFMGTQMAIMVSPAVITRALQSPDLQGTDWAKQFIVNNNFQPQLAITKLQDALSPRLQPQTTLIKLSFSWRKKDDARIVNEAVTNAYLTEVRSSNNQTSVEQREVLNGRRRDINDELTRLGRQRENILVTGRITNLREGANAEEQKQGNLTKDIVDVVQQLASVKSLLERMQMAEQNNGVRSFPQDMVEDAKMDPVIQELTRQISQSKVDEESLRRQGYKDEHPTMIALRQRIRAAEAQKDEEMKVVLQRMYDSNVESYRKSVDSLTARKSKLESDLEETSRRKQDLLKMITQVDQIDDQVKQLNLELAEVDAARRNLEMLTSSAVFDQVRLIISPQTPNQVSFPKLMIMLPLGVLLLSGLTACVVLLRELMDQRVKGPADVAMIPRLRVLGMVPDAAEDPARPASIETAFRDTPGGVVTESFRQVRAPLVKKMDTEGLRTVLVMAGMPGSGATTVACNLALACAGSDDRVLIIDANVRRPAIHRVFGLSDAPGLADCLAGQVGFDEAVRPSGVNNVSVVCAGSAANRMMPERLSTDAMSRLLAEAAGKFDRVFIDCPPAIVSGDGLALANRCDAVIMVVRALSEKRGLVNRIRTQLTESRAELLGVVVNAVKSSAGGYFKRNIQATHEYHNTGASA